MFKASADDKQKLVCDKSDAFGVKSPLIFHAENHYSSW